MAPPVESPPDAESEDHNSNSLEDNLFDHDAIDDNGEANNSNGDHDGDAPGELRKTRHSGEVRK